jgi:protein-disulfide isomerase
MLVEFSDYECPFSKRARETVWEVMDTYKDRVRYVFRDFPLSFHRNARKAHEAAHCAGDQGKYFEYSRLLFEDQGRLSMADLVMRAKAIGLNVKKFDRCLEKGEYSDLVKESIASGTSAGVSGTPAFFVNGIFLSGAQPLAAFAEVIDSELEKK